MYSLDINFLSDRTERSGGGNKKKGRGGGNSTAQASPLPLILGVIVGLALPALTGGYWLTLQGQKSAMEERRSALDNQLSAVQAQLKEVTEIDAKVKSMEADNQAIASVFDRIKPWSAMLQDIRDRVPTGVQIRMIEQFTPAASASPASPASPSPPPSPSPSPGESPAAAAPAAPAVPEPPLPKIRITGQARSFNDVNDFVLTLQRSPFLEPKDARLVTSKLVDSNIEIRLNEQIRGNVDVKMPQMVEFTLETGMTNLTASQLMQDLQRTLAVGLASRIQTLRDRGVLKP